MNVNTLFWLKHGNMKTLKGETARLSYCTLWTVIVFCCQVILTSVESSARNRGRGHSSENYVDLVGTGLRELHEIKRSHKQQKLTVSVRYVYQLTRPSTRANTDTRYLVS